MADFFEPKKEEETTVEEQNNDITLNGKTYTQDELTQLVGLGELGREVETKYNTKLDRVYPEFTKSTQALKEAQEKLDALERERVVLKEQSGSELSPEEMKAKAIAEAEGLGLVHAGNIKRYVAEYMEGAKLLEDVTEITRTAAEKGIKTTPEDLLKYMDAEGFRNPQKAFKDMFEDQLKEWESKQLNNLKTPGLVTQSSSSAGSKVPADVKVDRNNLDQLVAEALAEQL
jgi:hypothetical protein